MAIKRPPRELPQRECMQHACQMAPASRAPSRLLTSASLPTNVLGQAVPDDVNEAISKDIDRSFPAHEL